MRRIDSKGEHKMAAEVSQNQVPLQLRVSLKNAFKMERG